MIVIRVGGDKKRGREDGEEANKQKEEKEIEEDEDILDKEQRGVGIAHDPLHLITNRSLLTLIPSIDHTLDKMRRMRRRRM